MSSLQDRDKFDTKLMKQVVALREVNSQQFISRRDKQKQPYQLSRLFADDSQKSTNSNARRYSQIQKESATQPKSDCDYALVNLLKKMQESRQQQSGSRSLIKYSSDLQTEHKATVNNGNNNLISHLLSARSSSRSVNHEAVNRSNVLSSNRNLQSSNTRGLTRQRLISDILPYDHLEALI